LESGGTTGAAEQLRATTGFAIEVPDDAPRTPLPTAQQLAMLRRPADPLGIRGLDFVPTRESGTLVDEVIRREGSFIDAAIARREIQS
jgi:hypothetical protein